MFSCIQCIWPALHSNQVAKEGSSKFPPLRCLRLLLWNSAKVRSCSSPQIRENSSTPQCCYGGRVEFVSTVLLTALFLFTVAWTDHVADRTTIAAGRGLPA